MGRKIESESTNYLAMDSTEVQEILSRLRMEVNNKDRKWKLASLCNYLGRDASYISKLLSNKSSIHKIPDHIVNQIDSFLGMDGAIDIHQNSCFQVSRTEFVDDDFFELFKMIGEQRNVTRLLEQMKVKFILKKQRDMEYPYTNFHNFESYLLSMIKTYNLSRSIRFSIAYTVQNEDPFNLLLAKYNQLLDDAGLRPILITNIPATRIVIDANHYLDKIAPGADASNTLSPRQEIEKTLSSFFCSYAIGEYLHGIIVKRPDPRFCFISNGLTGFASALGILSRTLFSYNTTYASLVRLKQSHVDIIPSNIDSKLDLSNQEVINQFEQRRKQQRESIRARKGPRAIRLSNTLASSSYVDLLNSQAYHTTTDTETRPGKNDLIAMMGQCFNSVLQDLSEAIQIQEKFGEPTTDIKDLKHLVLSFAQDKDFLFPAEVWLINGMGQRSNYKKNDNIFYWLSQEYQAKYQCTKGNFSCTPPWEDEAVIGDIMYSRVCGSHDAAWIEPNLNHEISDALQIRYSIEKQIYMRLLDENSGRFENFLSVSSPEKRDILAAIMKLAIKDGTITPKTFLPVTHLFVTNYNY